MFWIIRCSSWISVPHIVWYMINFCRQSARNVLNIQLALFFLVFLRMPLGTTSSSVSYLFTLFSLFFPIVTFQSYPSIFLLSSMMSTFLLYTKLRSSLKSIPKESERIIMLAFFINSESQLAIDNVKVSKNKKTTNKVIKTNYLKLETDSAGSMDYCCFVKTCPTYVINN